MMVDFSYIKTCAQLTPGDIARALAPAGDLDEPSPRDKVRALLAQLAQVSRPHQGAPRLLIVCAHLATREWLDGGLRLRLSADGLHTSLDLLVDDGVTAERFADRLNLNAPIGEFINAVGRRPDAVLPLQALPQQDTAVLELEAAAPVSAAEEAGRQVMSRPLADRDYRQLPSVASEVPEADEDPRERSRPQPEPGQVAESIARLHRWRATLPPSPGAPDSEVELPPDSDPGPLALPSEPPPAAGTIRPRAATTGYDPFDSEPPQSLSDIPQAPAPGAAGRLASQTPSSPESTRELELPMMGGWSGAQRSVDPAPDSVAPLEIDMSRFAEDGRFDYEPVAASLPLSAHLGDGAIELDPVADQAPRGPAGRAEPPELPLPSPASPAWDDDDDDDGLPAVLSTLPPPPDPDEEPLYPRGNALMPAPEAVRDNDRLGLSSAPLADSDPPESLPAVLAHAFHEPDLDSSPSLPPALMAAPPESEPTPAGNSPTAPEATNDSPSSDIESAPPAVRGASLRSAVVPPAATASADDDPESAPPQDEAPPETDDYDDRTLPSLMLRGLLETDDGRPETVEKATPESTSPESLEPEEIEVVETLPLEVPPPKPPRPPPRRGRPAPPRPARSAATKTRPSAPQAAPPPPRRPKPHKEKP